MIENPFKTISKDEVGKMAVPMTATNFVYHTETQGLFRKTVFEIDRALYTTIENIFFGKPENKISKGDKVYILPGHSLGQERIKEYLKSIGANSTKTLNACTVIGGSTDFSEVVDRYSSQPRLSSLMFRLETHHYVVENDESRLEGTLSMKDPEETEDLIKDFKAGVPIIYSGQAKRNMGWSNTYNLDISNDEKYFITAEGVELLFYILSKKLKVITDSEISDSANSSMKFEDIEVFKSVNMMLSGDHKDQQMGLEILAHCDLRGDIMFHTWLLAKEHYNKIASGVKTKGLGNFLKKTNFHSFKYKDASEMMGLLNENNQMTLRAMEHLVNECFEEKKRYHEEDPEVENRFLSKVDPENFTITIQLKEGWFNQLKELRNDNNT